MALSAKHHQVAGDLVLAHPHALVPSSAEVERICRELAALGACAELKPRDTPHGEWIANSEYLEHLLGQASTN